MSELDDARNTLKGIQDFDVPKLAREADLGATFNFSEALVPATRLVDMYRRIPIKSLDDFPPGQLNQLQQFAQQTMTYFQQIMTFDLATASNPGAQRKSLIQQLIDYYNSTWPTLQPFIAYGAARTADLGRLEKEGRDAIASVQGQTATLLQQLKSDAEASKKLLDEVRAAAAEQGVSQQAVYFQQEAARHDEKATQWRIATISLAVAIGLYAVLTMFAHYIPALQPKDAYESAQIITGKVFIFAVLAYMLLLSARNFLAHTHNSIVNRHRQNALLTFTAMTEAGGTPAARDVVLGQAAACIYAPQETGYTKTAHTESSLPQALIQMIARTDTK
jgi:hypothetical protein